MTDKRQVFKVERSADPGKTHRPVWAATDTRSPELNCSSQSESADRPGGAEELLAGLRQSPSVPMREDLAAAEFGSRRAPLAQWPILVSRAVPGERELEIDSRKQSHRRLLSRIEPYQRTAG